MSFDPRLVFEDEGRLAHAVEELLLREIGHALDAVWGASSRPSWLAAVERDAGHASGLAETDPTEDFAETFTVWAAYRRDLARPSASAG